MIVCAAAFVSTISASAYSRRAAGDWNTQRRGTLWSALTGPPCIAAYLPTRICDYMRDFLHVEAQMNSRLIRPWDNQSLEGRAIFSKER